MITTIADNTLLQTIYTSQSTTGQGINLPLTDGSNCSMEIQNYSPFPIQIYQGKTMVEQLPPYSWLIGNFNIKSTVSLVYPTNIQIASSCYITATTLHVTFPRTRGDFQVAINQNIPITTSVTNPLTVESVTNPLSVGNTVATNVQNAVQTNALVYLGSQSIPVVDLADGQTITSFFNGTITGYFETTVLEGTSQNGYTYLLSAEAFNRSTNIGSFTLTQSDGANGEFYSTGSLTAKESFSNMELNLQAQVTAPSTIFTDPMTANTNWTIQSGSATFGASGASLTATGTIVTENTFTSLEPQNLTLQAQLAVEGTIGFPSSITWLTISTTANSYNSTIAMDSSGTAHVVFYSYIYNSTYANIGYVTVTSTGTVSGITWLTTSTTASSYNPTIAMDSSGTAHVVFYSTIYISTYWNIGYVTVTSSGTVSSITWLTTSTTANSYNPTIAMDSSGTAHVVFYSTIYNSTYANIGYVTVTSSGTASSITWLTTSTSAGSVSPIIAIDSSGTVHVVFYSEIYNASYYNIGYISYPQSSHTTVGTMYYQSIIDYYLLEWKGSSLSIIKNTNGASTTLASSASQESSTNVTLKLVVASNGNLTGTMTGSTTTTVTANDTTITSGALGVYGDNGAVASSAYISGNYIPADTVTIDIYAT